MKTKLLHGLLILSLLFSLMYVPRSAEAAAPDFGRGMDQWYFTGQSDFDAHQLFTESPDISYEGFMPFPYSYPDNELNADSFIEAIRIRLWSPTDFNRARAAALVNMMLGIDGNDAAYNGPSPERWRNGVTVAQARFDEMKALVYAYDAAGLANFNAIYYEENPKDWSGAVAGYDAGGNIIPANDAIHHTLSEVINGPTVEFYAPDHTPLMIILKNCANLLGDTKPLNPPPPPPTTACVGGMSPSVSTPSVNEAFDIVMKINANVGGPGNVQISGPASWSGNPAFTYDGATSQSSATVSYTPPSPGRYTVTWDAPTISPACSADFVVYNKPYFKVFSGDVQVGAAFPGAPLGPEATTAQIWAFNNNGQGASTQLAAMAIGTIDQFGSAYNSAQPGGSPYSKLTFANAGGGYGGTFGAGGASTIPDYKQLFALNGVTAITSDHTIGATTVNPGAANAQDVFVQGDVYINGNIVYAGSGTWTLANMPSFRLVVEGNIYISSTVTQLDGIYVALPDGVGSGGNIYTCANGMSAPDAAFIAAQCGNKLTINGAFIADKVKLLRSGGGVHQAAGVETAGSTNAAEVFVYGPETWLSAPKYAPTQGYGYDSITSLPPVLYRD